MRSVTLSHCAVGLLFAPFPTFHSKKIERCLPIGTTCEVTERCPACCEGQMLQLDGLKYCSIDEDGTSLSIDTLLCGCNRMHSCRSGYSQKHLWTE